MYAGIQAWTNTLSHCLIRIWPQTGRSPVKGTASHISPLNDPSPITCQKATENCVFALHISDLLECPITPMLALWILLCCLQVPCCTLSLYSTESENFQEELGRKYVNYNIVYIIMISRHCRTPGCTKDFAKDIPRRCLVNSSAIQQCTQCSIINELSEGPCLRSDNLVVLH